MSVYVEYCLFCDECHANWSDDGNADIKPQARRRLAKKNGWGQRRFGEMVDLCPKCLKKHEEEAT